MTTLRKHWISLKEAHSELMGWQDKWYDWYYPYSKWLSIGKGVFIGLVVAAGFYFTTGLIKWVSQLGG